ncbi:MAG: DUF262 domain-containing protein [Oscillatoriales cyanobacterium]|uniref:DUF262 domain-containing protein n=1 Tax=unclassified Microcoleus TaxID=2642155 RepID=UPI001DC854B9|nr:MULTISPECIES: DUF262 domain-containing protein [unclassified Microcoleus]MCC3435935.1 DUF262 domain-containing protein [Microcoleus sp. PH2017_05_CCC_O_A]MCC3492043.1 DUF262 domain-containing protein [Microcoleus sp. PH2017_16_JOR_D_A]TAG19405.1 MAG: DUF262 domain-containing protein [Oscillatoriales cyanobacterium]
MSQALRQDIINIAEEQIDEIKQKIDYYTTEYAIEFIVDKYLEQDDAGLGEIYLPEFHRNLRWGINHQSRFIESIILGVPIAAMIVAEIEETGKIAIVDGAQRVMTLAAFLTNQLQLSNLETLDSLNGSYFKDLAPSRQRKFKNTSLRMIVLSDKADERVISNIFYRINTSNIDPTRNSNSLLPNS